PKKTGTARLLSERCPSRSASYAAGRKKAARPTTSTFASTAAAVADDRPVADRTLRSTALRSLAEDRIVLGPTSTDARKIASLACLFLRLFGSECSNRVRACCC